MPKSCRFLLSLPQRQQVSLNCPANPIIFSFGKLSPGREGVLPPDKPHEFREFSASFDQKTRRIHVNSAGFVWWAGVSVQVKNSSIWLFDRYITCPLLRIVTLYTFITSHLRVGLGINTLSVWDITWMSVDCWHSYQWHSLYMQMSKCHLHKYQTSLG